MVTAARNRKKMLGCISGHESTISTSARTLSPTASPYQGRPGTAERRRRVSVCGAPSVSLDVCCVDSKRDRKGVIIVSPHQGAKDGPTQPYPTARPNGRGPQRPVLPHRRRLRPPQPQGEALRIHKAACRLGGHNPRPPAAAAGRGVRALLLARCPAVLLPPVPRGRGASPFLVAPQGEEAQALSGAPQAGGRPRVGRRSGNPPGRLHAAGRAASPPSRPVRRFAGSGVG